MALKPNALATLSDVLGLRPCANLVQAELVINAISQDVEDFLGRQLQYAELTELVAESGGDFLQLSRRPLVTVTSVVANGSPITDFERSATWDRWGCLYRRYGWPACHGSTGHPTQDPDSRYPNQVGIEVEYAAGWLLPNDATVSGVTSLPDNIRLAVLNEVVATLDGLATAAFGNRTMSLIEETTPGGWRRKWTASNGRPNSRLSAATIAILNRYSPKVL